MLKIENISFQDNGKDILKNINLQIQSGEYLTIVGSSGAGKSTLLKIIADLKPYSTGNLYYLDKKYEEYDPLELRQKITYVAQSPHLFGKTIRDNFAFTFQMLDESFDEQKAKDFLRFFKLDFPLEQAINNLSGGEIQRIALIRSLLLSPDVLLLDEVSSALDPESQSIVQKAICDLNKQGMTIVWITHDLDLSVEGADRRITMHRGEIQKVEVLNNACQHE